MRWCYHCIARLYVVLHCWRVAAAERSWRDWRFGHRVVVLFVGHEQREWVLHERDVDSFVVLLLEPLHELVLILQRWQACVT